jgi:hypothetical protein
MFDRWATIRRASRQLCFNGKALLYFLLHATGHVNYTLYPSPFHHPEQPGRAGVVA